MKTQITSLKRGNRMEVGSSNTERMAIAEKVMTENPNGMTIKIHGIVLHLHPVTSHSGRVVAYNSEQLTSEQVAKVLPFDIKAIEHPELVDVRFSLFPDMKCEWATSRRTRETQEWKAGQTIPVSESDVTIMDDKKTTVLYQETAQGQSYAWLTVKETEKSYIVMTRGKVERELRFHKTSKMEQDIEYLKRTEDGPWFYHCYIESGDVHPYWKHERKVC